MKFADLKKQGFNWKGIFDFCRKNIRYISAGIIVIVLVIVLAIAAKSQKSESGEGSGKEQGAENVSISLVADTVPEINTLIQNYYTAYAAGDIATLETCATPISDKEKGYITVMSQYIAGYENIVCYSTPGMAENEYLVFAQLDMRFEGVETVAPGLESFYVRQFENGAYYIDNLYSHFNAEFREVENDSQVEAWIAEYESQADVLELCTQVQTKYEAALAADEALKTMAEVTIPQALQGWLAQLNGEQPAPEQPAPAPEQQAPEATTPEQPAPEATAPVKENVYATSNVNIRTQPLETAEKAGSALMGQPFVRTATTADGWSEIEFNGGKAYIKSDFVSTQPVTITLSESLNVRAAADENSDKVGTAEAGHVVTILQNTQEGWTQVNWNGTTGYIRTDLILSGE